MGCDFVLLCSFWQLSPDWKCFGIALSTVQYVEWLKSKILVYNMIGFLFITCLLINQENNLVNILGREATKNPSLCAIPLKNVVLTA